MMFGRNKPSGKSSSAGGRTLHFQLLLGINLSVAAILVGFMLWDYSSEWKAHLREKQLALREEAETLLPAVAQQVDDPEAIQEYIDEVCGRMRESSSPGHHIAIRIRGAVLQARAHHRQSQQMYRAMRLAAGNPGGLADSEGGRIVVGTASNKAALVLVSEYLLNIEHLMREQLARRMLSIVCLGATLAVVVNLLISRVVSKPVNAIVGGVRKIASGELGAQVPSPKASDLRFLADEFNSMSSALAQADRERRRQMEKARRIQEHLKPSGGEQIGLSMTYIYEPATEVAGDYFDIKQLNDGVVLFCVADVTGHGVPAAMGASMLKTLFASATRETAEPGRVLAAIDGGFANVTLVEDFASMIVVALDRVAGRLSYASAGHDSAYVTRTDEEVQVLPSTGPLLGIHEAPEWDTVELELVAGDRLIMVTDGIIQTISPEGEMFGEQRLLEILEENKSKPLDALRREIIHRLAKHRGQNAQSDDITLLAVEL